MARKASSKAKAAETADAPRNPDAEFTALRVTGPRRGRWRAGRFFTAEPVDIPLSDLSGDEAAAIRADGTLTVEEVPYTAGA